MVGIWVILSWIDSSKLSDLSLSMNLDGTPRLFDSAREAQQYAVHNYGQYKIVQI